MLEKRRGGKSIQIHLSSPLMSIIHQSRYEDFQISPTELTKVLYCGDWGLLAAQTSGTPGPLHRKAKSHPWDLGECSRNKTGVGSIHDTRSGMASVGEGWG